MAVRSQDNEVPRSRLKPPAVPTSLVLEPHAVIHLERPKVTVGFIPLIDCAPVLFAEVLGLYERHGLDVELRREVSWSNIRDKVALGLLDAAHMLSPMPLATTLGIDSVDVPMIAAMTLHLNGNSITLSNALWREIDHGASFFLDLEHTDSGA